MQLRWLYSRTRWLTAILLWLAAMSRVWAQQETADRLWQGTEQQLQRARRQSNSAPLEEKNAQRALSGPALAALTLPPLVRIQQITQAILIAVNRQDWFGADRLLRQYVQVPQHDPALETFVAASRLAAEGDFPAAIAGYREALQSNRQFVRAELDLARVEYVDNRLRDAREAFERLRAQQLPPEVERHIDDFRRALDQRDRTQILLTVSAVREDNVNTASTVVDPCALVFLETCLANTPGQKIADSGIYVETSLNKLWPMAGNHGVLLRSINYGNHYQHEDDYDNFVSTSYLGYQYASARTQIQVLPLFEYDNEGGREIYRAFGLRTVATRQVGDRVQVEASLEYKARHFAPHLAENLQGDFRSAAVSGQYARQAGWQLYGHLAWRESDAQLPIFAYREKAARLGAYKSFGPLAVNMAYGWRQKKAEGTNAVFGKLQRDQERSLYLNVSLPAYRRQGLTPVLSYEYRDNRSSIPHAYNYQKNRLTLGFNAVF